MKRFAFLRIVAVTVVLFTIMLGCSDNSSSPVSPDQQLREASTTDISLDNFTQTGQTISVPVKFSKAKNLCGLSFRLGFDPEGLRPYEVKWGNIVEESDLTFQLLDRKGFVPLAYAGFANGKGLNGSGILCTVNFSIIDPQKSDVWIIDDPQYLVGKDSVGRNIRIRARGEGR